MSIIAQSIARIGIGSNPNLVARLGLYSQEESSGRSGYWRLFYTQLQEQSLKGKPKPESAPVFKEPYQLKEQSDGSVLVITDKPKKPQPEPIPEPEPLPVLPPMVRSKASESITNFIANAWYITAQIRDMVTKYELSVVKFNQDGFSTEEDDIETLLLLM